MTKHDFSQLLKGADLSDPVLLRRANNRLLSGDPELQSLLWLLREGVIARGQFPSLVESVIRH